MADSPNPFAIQIISAIPAALASFPMERRRARAHPETLPYTWGIFVGLQTVVMGGFFGLVWAASLFADDTEAATTFTLFVVAALYSAAGVYSLRRYRWAWVLATILSFNPVWWIANAIYGRNRWKELHVGRLPRIPTRQDDHAERDAPGRATTTASLTEQLRELDLLRKEGILSDDEFSLKKKQLLGL